MGRTRKTWKAKLSADRQHAIDSQGRPRISLDLETGDVGRAVDAYLAEGDLDRLHRWWREALLRHAREQWDHAQEVWSLQVQVWEEQTRNKKLEGEIERLQEAAPSNKSSTADLPEKREVLPQPSRLTH
jgi:hypothetical protein